MTWVMLSLRKATLKSRMSDLQMQSLQLSQRIQDLQHYASSIADGSISMSEMANSPSSIFGTQMQYIAASSPIAYQSAQIKTTAYLQQMGQLQMDTQGQYQLVTDPTGATSDVDPYLVFNEIYKQELKEYSKQIGEKVHAEEKELESQRLRIESQLKAAEAEYESVAKQEDSNIKNDAIRLA
ncbi:hypothetical protein tpqmel_0057 [Candidatus Gastranaerophilus sp. (ex Termes propinquus)]|nr:hypothetical protein tpqmel_0057 [Candidatus Gastranaerophilus sp. (ex Termes propinquus)]